MKTLSIAIENNLIIIALPELSLAATLGYRRAKIAHLPHVALQVTAETETQSIVYIVSNS